MQQNYTFHIHGLHCASCVLLTEHTLQEVRGVVCAKTSLAERTIQVTGDFEKGAEEDVMQTLADVLRPHGYTLALEKQMNPARWSEFIFAVPAALSFIVVFVLLQKFGVVNLIHISHITYGTAFVVGLVASISTCMAVVGGLVLSLSASFAKEGDRVRPQLLFHVARLCAFFLFGGIIGVLGSVFQFGPTGMLVLGLLVATVLCILGLNLLEVFPWMRRFQLTMPQAFGRQTHRWKTLNHSLTPILVGIMTFFLPCGFTQSMQIYTLTTGNFWKGGFTMLAFALGTAPVLALLSFSALGIRNMAHTGVFFKTVGLVILFFSLFALVNTLAGAGIISPLFNF